MAVAGIVIHVREGHLAAAREVLRASPAVAAIQDVDAASSLAVVLQSPSQRLCEDMEALSALEQVLQLDVVYVNYEEDADGQGHMACPPRRPRCRGGFPGEGL